MNSPRNAKIPAEIGMYFQSRNMPIKAEMFYMQSLKLNDDQAVIYFNLGLINQMLNKTDKAINAYLRAISINPDYPRAYANLGYIYSQKGERDRASENFKAAIRLDPDNAQLKHMMASAGFVDTPTAADQKYIKDTFDEYADHYDEHLLVKLKSKTPSLVHQSVMEQLNDRENDTLDILDLGCGTGLCGELFRNNASRMVGVDLSEKMVNLARKKDIYDELYIEDICEHIIKYDCDFDAILASDVFVYLGDLKNITLGAYNAMRTNSILSFTVEALVNVSDDYILDQSGRYKHNDDYIKTLMQDHHFTLLSMKTDTIRVQAGEGVMGYVYAFKKD